MGGGRVAQAKLEQLLRAGASVTVVALAASEAFRALAEAHPSQVRLLLRAVSVKDLAGRRLVVSATNDGALNARLARAAAGLNTWFNAVDDPEHCEFHFAASLVRGPYHVAIGTEGRFPGLSGALRAFLDEVLPEEHGDLLERLAELRGRLRRDVPDPGVRRRALHRLLDGLKQDYFHALGALAELS